MPLTPTGEAQAKELKPYLGKINFSEVWCSPLLRARETCKLAGFADRAVIVPELTEWNAGEYEGLENTEIRKRHPDWAMMIHGAPGGESVADIEKRVAVVIDRMKTTQGNVLIFSSSHLIRALAACFIGQSPSFAVHLQLGRGAVSVLDYENRVPVIRLWNHHSELVPL